MNRLWSVQDVSTFLGVPVTTLYQWPSPATSTAPIDAGSCHEPCHDVWRVDLAIRP